MFIRTYSVSTNGILIKDLSMEFSMEKTATIEADNIDITISNLSDSTLSKIKKGEKLAFSAGYDDTSNIVLFNGLVTAVETVRGPGEKRTVIKAVDKLILSNKEAIIGAYNAGISKKDIINNIMKKDNQKVTGLYNFDDLGVNDSSYSTIKDSVQSIILELTADMGDDSFGLSSGGIAKVQDQTMSLIRRFGKTKRPVYVLPDPYLQTERTVVELDNAGELKNRLEYGHVFKLPITRSYTVGDNVTTNRGTGVIYKINCECATDSGDWSIILTIYLNK